MYCFVVNKHLYVRFDMRREHFVIVIITIIIIPILPQS